MSKQTVKDTSTKCRSEHEEQVLLCHWVTKNYPELPFFAIPNGGHRNKVTAYKLKAEGVKPGVPDLFFPSLWLFIEMKKNHGGSVSASQKEWHETLSKIGYRVEVCKGFEAAKNVLINLLTIEE